MMHRTRSRVAALLLMAALAACSDAPTGATITAADQPAAFNTAPTVTVTDSGGYPLISWGALTGATSYSVTLVFTETRFNRYLGESTSWESEYPLGSTTGTSFLDSQRAYTGEWLCAFPEDPNYPYGWRWRQVYSYTVVATFPDGSSQGFTWAPVAQC